MKTKWAPLFSLSLAIFFCIPHVDAEEPTRAEFAAAMGKITKGMKAAEVVKLLGKPDDSVTQADPGGLDIRNAEIWGYGGEGHLTYPTLGRVTIIDGVVQEAVGGKGTLPDAAMFDEANLRKLLRLVASCCAGGTNPRLYIQTVNTLIPLGKEKALAVIAEFDRVGHAYPGSEVNGSFLLLRLLFDVPAKSRFASSVLGPTLPEEPEDLKILPLYPLALVDGIPLDLVSDYLFPSANKMAVDYVKYFRENGTIRQHPLVPGNDPLSALATLGKSQQWIYRDKFEAPASTYDKRYLAHQLLQLINTVYRIDQDETEAYDTRDWLPNDNTLDQRWDKIVKDVAALHIKWDAEKNIYVFADGTSLPELQPPLYKRNIWYVRQVSPDAKLTVERKNRYFIAINFFYSEYREMLIPDSVLRICRTGAAETPIYELRIPASAGKSSSGHVKGKNIKLPAGETLQAEIVSGGKTVKGDIFMP